MSQAAIDLWGSSGFAVKKGNMLTETTVARGDFLANEHNLRGYDATHLACALLWQEAVGLPLTLATFDQQLTRAARDLGMGVLPNGEVSV